MSWNLPLSGLIRVGYYWRQDPNSFRFGCTIGPNKFRDPKALGPNPNLLGHASGPKTFIIIKSINIKNIIIYVIKIIIFIVINMIINKLKIFLFLL